MVELAVSNNTSLSRVDHLVYACANLDAGIREVRGLLGVQPAIGGRHALYGTHNALLSLGPATYLEIVARDPDLPSPQRGPWIDVVEGESSRLQTWVLRAEEIEAATAGAAGIGLGPIGEGSRETPDGTTLSWRLTDPYAMPLGGTIPFVISWGATPHPAASAPRAGELRRLVLKHPEARRVETALEKLGIVLEVVEAQSAALIAAIETPDGIVELR